MDYWQPIRDLLWFLFLLLMLRHFWKERQHLLASQDWLVTKGQITRLEWTQQGSILWPKIEYTYQINEKDYLGEYIFLDTSHNTPYSRYARRVIYLVALAYKSGGSIDVYYNPNDPRQSALDISLPKKLNVIIWLLISLIVLHVVLVGWHWWKW